MRRRSSSFRVDSCCCGCTLKTGTIIIATLQALGGLGIALAMARNVAAGRAGAGPGAAADEVALVSARNHGLSPPEARAVNRLLADLSVDARALSAAVAALGGMQFVFSVMLIYGANNESAWLVRPWVLFAAGATLLGAGAYVAVALLTWLAGVEGAGAGIIIGLLPACGTMLYFILVVHSFYLQLLEGGPLGRGACAATCAAQNSPVVDLKGPPPAIL
ncbi:hypothetical protein R5R35_009701 [Gryllus longicercus]|uniref:Uncharacterized protein n=1 Tax=Gryllus longicercus TaxID=2509291 RepID=A0AAN9VIS4_9ORTH